MISKSPTNSQTAVWGHLSTELSICEEAASRQTESRDAGVSSEGRVGSGRALVVK